MNQITSAQPTDITTTGTATRNPVAVYLASLKASSRRTMLQSLNAIAEIVTGQSTDSFGFPWANLRYEHAQAIRSQLAERYKPATANRHLSALRGVLKECWRLGYIQAEDYHKTIDVKSIRGGSVKQAEKGRHIASGELSAMLNTTLDGSIAGARDAALLIVAYTCGLRRAEIASLMIDDVDLEQCTLIVRRGKGDKERVIPLADSACDALRDWIIRRGTASGSLFLQVRKGDKITENGLTAQAIYYIFNQRSTIAGVKSFSPHDLRRTFIGELLDNGNDIVTVAGLAGHASVETTAGYDRRGSRAKRKAVDTLHVAYKRQYGENT